MTRERGARRNKRAGAGQKPWRRIENRIPPLELLRPEQIETIHDASLTILEDVGMEFLHPSAVDVLRAAGADVEAGSPRVRFDRGLVMEAVARAPSQFTLHARNPDRDVILGGNHLVFATVASAPNVSGRGQGRRRGNKADFDDLIRLAQGLNVVHTMGGYPVEPVDLDPRVRHLEAVRSMLTLSDKVPYAYALGGDRIRDGIEMARIARGIDRDRLLAEPSLFTIVNTNSPLRLDVPMLDGLMAMARHRQPVVITPFTLAGAMAPATIAGALVQQNAEALAGIALVQLVQPGAPVVYGSFTSNVDMRSGAPAFGTPEYAKATIASGQLARRYRLPFRTSNANASNAVDCQSAYESAMSLWAAVLGHGNLIMHAAGWLEGGLQASFAKMVVDAEMLQAMAEFAEPMVVDDETLGISAIKEVGPGGHFFGAADTLSRYETAFYAPLLSDWRNFETWSEAGAPDATQRAERLCESLLEAYQPPAMDPAVSEALDAFIARRTEEGGVSVD